MNSPTNASAVTRRCLELQRKAVQLQDAHVDWNGNFLEQIDEDTISRMAQHPGLQQAESLYREILTYADQIPADCVLVTRHQLALLLHRMGRVAEAVDIYEQTVRDARLQPTPTNNQLWAAMHALFRLGELTIRRSRRRGEAFFTESRNLALALDDRESLELHQEAVDYFGLLGRPPANFRSSNEEIAHRAKQCQELAAEVMADAFAQPRWLALGKAFLAVLAAAAGALVVFARWRSAWLAVFVAILWVHAVFYCLIPRRSVVRRTMWRTMKRAVIGSSLVAVVLFLLTPPWVAALAGLLLFAILQKPSSWRVPLRDLS